MADDPKIPLGYVEIHGRLYRTVAKRVQEFRDKYTVAGGWGLVTEIVADDPDGRIAFKASILGANGAVIATGHAEELRGGSSINKASALENCETSAIGRALAAAGYAGSSLEYASAEEMFRAETQERIMDEGKMSPVKMRKYCDGMIECTQKGDGPGLLELVDELTNEQQGWLWQQFRSYERAAIKKLLAEAREAANVPDPNYQDGDKV